MVWLGGSLPAPVHRAAEFAVGALIVALAVRLLLRWRRGWFHVHAHRHEGVLHAHPTFTKARHTAPPRTPTRTRSRIALLWHPSGWGWSMGWAGTAFAGVLVAAAASGRGAAVATLILFAGAAAVAMAASAFRWASCWGTSR